MFIVLRVSYCFLKFYSFFVLPKGKCPPTDQVFALATPCFLAIISFLAVCCEFTERCIGRISKTVKKPVVIIYTRWYTVTKEHLSGLPFRRAGFHHTNQASLSKTIKDLTDFILLVWVQVFASVISEEG